MEVLRDFRRQTAPAGRRRYFQAASLVAQLFFGDAESRRWDRFASARSVIVRKRSQQPLYVAAWQRARRRWICIWTTTVPDPSAFWPESLTPYLRFGRVRLASLVTFDAALNQHAAWRLGNAAARSAECKNTRRRWVIRTC